MPKCKIDYSKVSNEEFKKKNLSAFEKQKELYTNKKTDTEIAEGFFQNVKLFLKNTGIAKFFSHLMGGRAATYDFINDLSPNKQRAMINEVIRQRKQAYSYIDGNEEAQEFFARHKSVRLTLATAKRVLEASEGADISKEAIEEIHMFSEYASDIQKATGKVPTVEELIEYVKTIKADMDKTIAASEDLSNVHKAMNGLFSVQTERIRRLNPEMFAELAGEYTSHDELIDNMMLKLGANRTSVAQKFYKRIMGVEFGGVVESPDMMDLVALHMMNHFVKSLEFSEFLKSDRVASEEIKKILESEKDAIVGNKTGVINIDYIEKLDNDNKLKIILKRLIDSSATNIENTEAMSAAIEKAKDGDFSDFFKEVKLNNLKLFNKTLRTIDDTVINTFIKNNKESLPNLYKLITNNTSYDASAAIDEIDTVYKASDTDKTTRRNMLFKIYEDNANIEAMKKQITIERVGNAEQAVKRLAEKFGDYSFTTRTGTKIFGDGVRIDNIKNNKELLGDLSELINPSIIFKDAMTIKEIQDRKYEAIVEKLVSGDIMLLKKESADAISDIKRDLNNFGADGTIAGISRVFSMTTLFNPLMYPGYALTTQIFGNIGHTMMADPTAFKHWPKFMGAMKKAWAGNFEAIEDPDMREIVRLLMTTEGSSLHSIALEDWDSPELLEITKQLEDKEMENPNKKNSAKIIKFLREKMLIDKTTKVASIIEMVSRGSMAYEVLAKKRAGKVFMPPTANKHRTEHLWDYNDHLAAVRVANDTHIDYSALPPAVRRWSALFPFMSFKVGSTFNMMRMFQNMFVETTKAMRTGNWKTAGSHMYRGGIGLAWRAGVAATLWNAVMVAIGAYKEGDRKRNNNFMSSSVFTKLFGQFGLDLDNHVYLPGTGFKPFDAVFRIGKANQKWDVMQAAEGFVPGTDKWQKAWEKDGALMGTVNASLGNVASSSNPLIKTSFEMLMGGGTIYEDGYHAKDTRITDSENLITKVAGFAGLGSLASASVRQIEGIDSTYKNEAAYDINDFKNEIDGRKRSEAKDAEYKARKLIEISISHMNTAMTLEYMRTYQHAYEKENEELKAAGKHVMSEQEIKHKVEDAVKRSTLEYKAKHDRDWVNSLTPEKFRKLQQSIEQEKIFLNSLGFGRW